MLAVAFSQIRELVHDADQAAVRSLGVLDFIHSGKLIVNELPGHIVRIGKVSKKYDWLLSLRELRTMLDPAVNKCCPVERGINF